MATKRMFSLKIIDSDAFTEMPNDSQLLYFRLCMAADDDGFIGNPRRVMRAYGISEDSMKILISKKFVLVLKWSDCAILLIKHWRMHNTIQRDRYIPSTYHALLSYIYLDENNAYSLTGGEGKRPALSGEKVSNSNLFPFCIQDVYTDKNRLDKSKVSLEENRVEENNISFIQEEKQEKEETPDWAVQAIETAKRLGIYREGAT